MVATTKSPTEETIRRPEVAHPNVPPAEQWNNVATVERVVGGILGGTLVLYALRRRGLVGLMSAALGGTLLYRSISGHCPVYSALGISTSRQGSAAPEDYFDRGIHVETSCVIFRPAAELYTFWRDFGNLPRFMTHLQSVEVLSPTRSRWTAEAPLGSVSWEAEIIHDQPQERIAWRSAESADVDNAGSVWFVELPEGGTEVRVNLDYIPPAGQLGAAVARLLGDDPEVQIREDLARFKELMESGGKAGDSGPLFREGS